MPNSSNDPYPEASHAPQASTLWFPLADTGLPLTLDFGVGIVQYAIQRWCKSTLDEKTKAQQARTLEYHLTASHTLPLLDGWSARLEKWESPVKQWNAKNFHGDSNQGIEYKGQMRNLVQMQRECDLYWERLRDWIPEIRKDVEAHLDGRSPGDAHKEWTLRGAIYYARKVFEELRDHIDQINRSENDLMDEIL